MHQSPGAILGFTINDFLYHFTNLAKWKILVGSLSWLYLEANVVVFAAIVVPMIFLLLKEHIV
jgi:hypothetical protein